MPVGSIRSPFKEPGGTPIRPVFGEKAEGIVEVFPAYVEGLCDLAGFECIWLRCRLDRAPSPPPSASWTASSSPPGVDVPFSWGRLDLTGGHGRGIIRRTVRHVAPYECGSHA